MAGIGGGGDSFSLEGSVVGGRGLLSWLLSPVILEGRLPVVLRRLLLRWGSFGREVGILWLSLLAVGVEVMGVGRLASKLFSEFALVGELLPDESVSGLSE